jgi:hypothetical protein
MKKSYCNICNVKICDLNRHETTNKHKENEIKNLKQYENMQNKEIINLFSNGLKFSLVDLSKIKENDIKTQHCLLKMIPYQNQKQHCKKIMLFRIDNINNFLVDFTSEKFFLHDYNENLQNIINKTKMSDFLYVQLENFNILLDNDYMLNIFITDNSNYNLVYYKNH